MKKIIVFGGAGFLGGHIADFLTKNNYHVTIFDRNPSTYLLPEQKFIQGDITDLQQVKNAMQGHDIVYNYAGVADIDEAADRPLETINTNIMGNTNILEACRQFNIERYIFASTIYVYSKLGSFYRSSKQACELIIEEYSKRYNIDFTILRYGSLYGPRAGSKNFLYRTIESALAGEKIVRHGNGEELRAYIHAYDAAQLSLKILEKEFKNQHVILTGNESVRIKDLLFMVKEMVEHDLEIEFNELDSNQKNTHYHITPYDFAPKIAKRITDFNHVDLGQGILDLMNQIHSQKASQDNDNSYKRMSENNFHQKNKKKAICALLLGREGSTGFPGKNTHPIFGRPLMRYPMMAAENSKYITHKYFSTDSQIYKTLGREHGWNIIDRPAELATSTALGEDAYKHAYEVIKQEMLEQGYKLESLVLLMCNSATILASTIDQGIEKLRADNQTDSVVTVSRYNMWSPLRARKINQDGYLDPFIPFETFGDPNNLNCDRDSQGDVLFADMGMSIVRPHCLDNLEQGLLPQKWMGQKILPIKQWGGLDIDYDWQVPAVEHWLKEHGFSDSKHPYENTPKIKEDNLQETTPQEKNIKIISNNNFHSGTDKSVFDEKMQEQKFAEYRNKWQTYPEKFIVNNFPIHLDIENTSCCNLACPMCARTHDKWGGEENGMMNMDIYKKIIDEGAENGLCSIKLSLRGEPLLHPNVVEMVKYAKEKGILDIYFNTNAMLLDERMARALIEAGLPRISISIEGITAEEYEASRPKAKFETLLQNIKKLNQIKQELNSPYPQIRIQTVLKPEEKHKFDKYINFWNEYADEVSYIDFREEGQGVDHRGKTANWACPFLWQRITILWDGTILPCLAHGVKDHSNLVLGKFPAVNIKNAWLSYKTQKMRTLHKQSKAHKIAECDECSYRGLELKKLNIK